MSTPAPDPPRAEPRIVTLLTTSPLDVAAAYAAVNHPQSGGIGLFAGVVRDHHEGAAVVSIEYEAWDERAGPALEAVARGVVDRYPGVRAVYVAHRLGPLEVGEASVVVAASAPHRHEAIDAATALIDDLKTSVPIWKREELASGAHRWPGTDTGA